MRQYFYTFLILIATCCLFNQAQGQYSWRHLGPDNLNGITRALVFDQSANLYVGSQGGGLWRSVNLGDSWNKISSYDAAGCNPNITSIAIDGNVIYVGTGATQFTTPYVERRLGVQPGYDYREEKSGFVGYLDGLPGGGVYVSTDNGESWKAQNATNNSSTETLNYRGPFTDIQKIAVSNGRVLMASHEGLYYSDDQLNSVSLAEGPEFFKTNVIFDVEVAANNTIFAVAHSQANPTDTDSLYVSTDNGNTFRAVTDPIIFTNARVGFVRSEVAVAPSDPNIIYLASTAASGEVSRIFRYNISENRWTQVGVAGPTFAPLGINGKNAFILSVYPDNPNELIIAGNNWYTLTEEEGWQLVGQSFNPANATYRESPMFGLAFHPTNPQIIALGTASDLFISRDRGFTFASRNRGLGTTALFSVGSVKTTKTEEGETTSYEAVTAGGQTQLVVNSLFNTELPSKKSFGTLSDIDYTNIAYSTVHPGGMIIQGTDGGLLRSLDFGLTFEQFYQIPRSPQVPNLVPANEDTIINQTDGNSAAGDLLDAPTPAQAVWVLDEYIPEELIGRQVNLEEELQTQVESDVFFCSQKYVWIAKGAFGDVLQARWNRLTSALVDGQDEVFTAMTISNDGKHTLYVASSLGNIWRIDNANDLENFDAAVNVVRMNESLSASGLSLIGNWISSLAIDPKNPDRLIITYASYGARSQGITTWLWITDNAQDSVPVFGEIRGLETSEPMYTSQFVIDPSTNESVLLVGTEKGMISLKGIEDQGFPFIPKVYLPDLENVVNEIPELSTTPVTDISVRPYSWVEDEDLITISKDFTTFISTYGQGIWTSSSFAAPRKAGDGKEEVEVVSNFFSKIYPNPSENKASLQLNMPENARVQIRVLDLTGKLYFSQQVELERGIRTLELPATYLARGIYLLEITAEGKTLSEKLSKKWIHN